MKRGQANRCHANTSNLWLANKDQHEIVICTGYALSNDGMWRQHSWLALRRPRSIQIIETTERRVAYFGFAMTEEEAMKFIENNY